MNYELAKKLKSAGFPEKYTKDCDCLPVLSLSNLIDACDNLVEDGVFLQGHKNQWTAVDGRDEFGIYGGDGDTPEEAVANLWLELNSREETPPKPEN